MNPPTYTTKQAAEYLGITPAYLKYLRTADAKKRGLRGPAFVRIQNFGGITGLEHVRYLEKDLNEWLTIKRSPPQIKKES